MKRELYTPFAGALHCAVVSPCIAIREHPTMGTIEIKSDALEDIDVKLTLALDAVKAAKGQKTDRVQELCTLVGLTKRDLAAGCIPSSEVGQMRVVC